MKIRRGSFSLASLAARFATALMLFATLGSISCESGKKQDKKDPILKVGRIVGRLGGAPSASQISSSQALTAAPARRGQTTHAVSSVESVTIHLTDASSGATVVSASSDASGVFAFNQVPVGSYKLLIEQDEYAETAYAVDTEVIEVTENSTVSIGLPVVKRVMLPSFPQPTTGQPVALDQESGLIYMAVDQGILALHPTKDTVDFLYASDGFRSEYGPSLLYFVRRPNSSIAKLLVITPSRVWVIDESAFYDDDGASDDADISWVINYDDEAIRSSLADKVHSFDIADPSAFIDTNRRGEEFDPHFYRFNATASGERVYVAAGDQAAVIDWSGSTPGVARVFKSSGRMAHYAAASNRLFFLQHPDRVLVIDAETLLEVPMPADLALDNPYRLLGVSSRPSNGDGYIAYTKLNTSNQEGLFLLVVDADDSSGTVAVLSHGEAAQILNAQGAAMEPGVPHWQASGDAFIVGDSLFQFSQSDGAFQPVATGAIINSSLSANGVISNAARSADVPNAILISYMGEDNAPIGFYYLDDSNPDVGIRVVFGKVPIVTLDEKHGRGFVFGDGALSLIYYNADDAVNAEEEVDLSAVGQQLLGGGAGESCSSAQPCPENGICAPVDEFNTDEGTCTPQARNPFRQFCGGIGEVSCDPGFSCNHSNPYNARSSGNCEPLSCANDEACPESFSCNIMRPEDCPPEMPDCHQQTEQQEGSCHCLDLSLCGPACTSDDSCPVGFLCAESGHCSVERCLSDDACPADKVCGVTEQGRACVTAGTAQQGDSCVSSSECATAYCRGGFCVTSCSKGADCAPGQECIASDFAGYCGEARCGGCDDTEICVADDGGGGHCQPGAQCVGDADCAQGLEVCAHGQCRTSCTASEDCGEGSHCLQGYSDRPILFCAPEFEVHCWTESQDPPGGGGFQGCPADAWCSESGRCVSGTPCAEWLEQSCSDGFTCIEGACRETCGSMADCGDDYYCMQGYHQGDTILYCGVQTELRCGYGDPPNPGCPQDRWCSETSMCLTGTPCFDWQTDVCGSNEICMGGACQAACSTTADCPEGEECSYMGDVSHMNYDEVVFTCQPSQCNCANSNDLCVSWDSASLGQCWAWEDCVSTGYTCTDSNYACETTEVAPSTDVGRCRCDNDQACGARCSSDAVCGQYNRCNTETGQCELDACSSSSDCDSDQVCGMNWENQRVCILPGERPAGIGCDRPEQCSSGACMWQPNGPGEQICVDPCNLTGTCTTGQTCTVVQQGSMEGMAEIRVCMELPNNQACASNEFSMDSMSASCSDGTPCSHSNPLLGNSCQWPTTCNDMGMGDGLCVCSDPVCSTSCGQASDCGESFLTCLDGVCRLRATCSSDVDCAGAEVCGLVDGSEELGPRCVAAGAGTIGSTCASHTECSSGLCLEEACVERCSSNSDCSSGGCHAGLLGQGDFVLGICQAQPCDCADSEVCNPQGECGAAPLCNDEKDCGQGQTCVGHLCRTACTRTDSCGPAEDCSAAAPGQPAACMPQSCQCAASEICVAEQCFEFTSCQDSSDCSNGSCLGGLCLEHCTHSGECAAELECVAMELPQMGDPMDPMQNEQRLARVCTLPICDCLDRGVDGQQTWCSGALRFWNQQQGPALHCMKGSDCNGCGHNTPEASYICSHDDIGGWEGRLEELSENGACYCRSLTDCGPSCGSHRDCPAGWLCNNSSACEVKTCLGAADCPADTVCGRYPNSNMSMENSGSLACRVPGPTERGGECYDDGDCATGICLMGSNGSVCSTTCDFTRDCLAGESCTFGNMGAMGGTGEQQAWPRFCATLPNGALCAGNEFAVEPEMQPIKCTDGTPCMDGSMGLGNDCLAPSSCNWSSAGQLCICEGVDCEQSCSVADDCGAPELTCIDGLCRGRIRCASGADCSGGEVCGLIDGHEETGPRCTKPGAASSGDSCTDHGECASGFCADGSCAQNCSSNSDCSSGQCQAMTLQLGDKQFLLATCNPDSTCSCQAAEVCNQKGACGPGPICNSNSDCGQGMACVDSFCFTACGANVDCPADQACTLSNAQSPLVCRDKACDCDATEFCIGSTCLTAAPCDDDNQCSQGRCVAGQCFKSCQNTEDDCQADGLECTAVVTQNSDPHMQSYSRVCSAPTCFCDAAPGTAPPGGTWCSGAMQFMNAPSGTLQCMTGEDCNNCQYGPDPNQGDWQCADFQNSSLDNTSWQSCRCSALENCGPSCSDHWQCGDGYLCQQERCRVVSCETDQDCPAPAVCGRYREDNGSSGKACRMPGPMERNAACQSDGECATGLCVSPSDGPPFCSDFCDLTADCSSGETCTLSNDNMGMPGENGPPLRLCTYLSNNGHCAGNEFSLDWHQARCSDGTPCFEGSQCMEPFSCGYPEWYGQFCVCEGSACENTCSSAQDCGHASMTCLDGLCRPRPRCTDDSSCQSGEVCGVVDNAEETGPRCVTPGAGSSGSGCANHSDCASGFCFDDICAEPCQSQGECGSGQCQGIVVPGSTDLTISICLADSSCDCAAGQVCNPKGDCGDGPLCNNNNDCGDSQACLDNFCFASCQSTQDCAGGDSCFAQAPGAALVCLVTDCNCAATEFCLDGTCSTAEPCQGDQDCFGGRCFERQCYQDCQDSGDCSGGLECVAVADPSDMWGNNYLRMCTTPQCNCGNNSTWCSGEVRVDGLSRQCLTNLSGPCGPSSCADNFECSWSFDPWVQDANDSCRCTVPEICGATCQTNADCASGFLCNSSQRCQITTCSTAQDCPEGTVCGMHPSDMSQLACRHPGPTARGEACHNDADCATGICRNTSSGNYCSSSCSLTEECEAGETCTRMPGLMGDMIEPRICTFLQDGRVCASNEFSFDDWQANCTTGFTCNWEQPDDCQFPYNCQNWGAGESYCICNDMQCHEACSQDSDCNTADHACLGSVCRPRPSCQQDSDCSGGQVCGLIDGMETSGQRCLPPGAATVGSACSLHGDCATGVCAGSVCAQTCATSGDCSTQECRAALVGGAGEEAVVSVCDSNSCGCSPTQVCNLEGVCGEGPLCHSDAGCGVNQACIANFCYTSCADNAECANGEDCSVVDYAQATICMPATCNCEAGEICLDGVCLASTPCQGDHMCGSGRCLANHCFENCGSSMECDSQLECLAVDRDPNEQMSFYVKVCTAPDCDCTEPNTWCSGTNPIGGLPHMCVEGDNCNNCHDPQNTSYSCEMLHYGVDWVAGEACMCVDMESCGPTCQDNSDCPPGFQCGVNQPNRCAVLECDSSTPCSGGLVCGRHPTLPTKLACREPGVAAEGVSCEKDQDCQSGICEGALCRSLCTSSADCDAQYECQIQGDQGDLLESMRLCMEPACNCKNSEDVCLASHSTCFRPVSCQPGGDDFNCVGTGSGYYCDSTSGDVCMCNDPTVCGSACGDHSDCRDLHICDSQHSVCVQQTCARDSECPGDTICPYPGIEPWGDPHNPDDPEQLRSWWDDQIQQWWNNRDKPRVCSLSGAQPDGGSCTIWSDCQSGLCWWNQCWDPCVDNSDCGGGMTCQLWQGCAADQDCQTHGRVYAFCYDWSALGQQCADCAGADQYCDSQGVCHSSQACTPTSCQEGWCNANSLMCE